MSLHDTCIPVFTRSLENLSRWLDKAEGFAKEKSFDVSVLLNARLAPDQYHFIRQVQATCDAAKFGGARLASKEPPKNPDTEQTIDELRARIRSTLDFLATLKPADFEGAEGRRVELPFMPGKVITGHNYLSELSLPNFFFHLTTAYSILRHNGVALGKTDFIGGLTLGDK